MLMEMLENSRGGLWVIWANRKWIKVRIFSAFVETSRRAYHVTTKKKKIQFLSSLFNEIMKHFKFLRKKMLITMVVRNVFFLVLNKKVTRLFTINISIYFH